jgi:type IV pilus assembly protein PilM
MLRLLNRNKQSIGLDIGSKVLKFIQLRPCRKHGYELTNFGFEELSPDCIVDGAIVSKSLVADAIRRLFSEKHIQNRRVYTSIAGHSVIVKRISLPIQSEKNLEESIRWEAEQYIPFDIADVNLDYQVLRRNISTETLDILLVAGKRDKIYECTSIVKMADKIPDLVDVDAFALQNAYLFNYRPTGKDIVALLDIGASIMTINIVSGTDFLFTRDVSVGGHHYTESRQKEFNLRHRQAEVPKHGEAVENINPAEARHVIDLSTEIICLEIQKTYDFLRSTTTADHVDRMIVSGGSVHTPGLIETLVRRFGIPAEKFDSFKKIIFDSKQFSSTMITNHAPDLAVATGLALRGAPPLFSPAFRARRRSKLSDKD